MTIDASSSSYPPFIRLVGHLVGESRRGKRATVWLNAAWIVSVHEEQRTEGKSARLRAVVVVASGGAKPERTYIVTDRAEGVVRAAFVALGPRAKF